MSLGGIGGVLDYSFGSRLALEASATKTHLDTVTQQVSTGMIAETYGGLGTGARISLSLRPEITRAQTWQANVTAATVRLQAVDGVLGQLGRIANDIYTKVLNLGTATAQDPEALAEDARGALQQVASLLNASEGGEYLLSGQNTADPPVPDAQNILSSNFVTGIRAQVSSLTPNNGAAVIAATLYVATAPGNSVFSATLGGPLPQVEVGEGQYVTTGMLANTNLSGPQTGASTTGSYAIDLMRALATVGSLTTAQIGLNPGLSSLLSDTTTVLSNVSDAITRDRAQLGTTEAMLKSQGGSLSATVTALTGQVSAVEEVDIAAASSRMSLLQTQLQASYKMIADTKSLSLADFL